jgi:hypothetical protein
MLSKMGNRSLPVVSGALLIEIRRPDCPNWRVLMFQTKRNEDTVPPGGTQTNPVRFVHVFPDSTRIGESIFYITILPR